MIELLAQAAPGSVVLLVALGFTTWIAGKALNILDRHINRKDPDDE